MEENNPKKKEPIKLLIGLILIVIIVIAVVLFLTNKEGDVNVELNTTLDKLVEKNELQTVTFTYNVIGKQCKEADCDKTSNNIDDYKYVVSCKGTVTAGVDFKKIKLNLNEETKTLLVEIPEATIGETNIASVNFLNGDKLPSSELVNGLGLCKETIKEKTNKDTELLEASKEQAKIILNLYYQKWIKSLGNDYKVEVK